MEVTKKVVKMVNICLTPEEAAALFLLTNNVNTENNFVGGLCYSIFDKLDDLGFRLVPGKSANLTISTKKYFGEQDINSVLIPEELKQ